MGEAWEAVSREGESWLARGEANPLETGLRRERAKEEEPEAREAKGEEGEPA